MPAAILAHVAVACQHVATIQVDPLFWQPIEPEQTNDSRDLNLEVDRANPIVVGFLEFGAQFAHLAPGLKRISSELPFFKMNNLGQLATEQAKSPPHVHHVNGHIQPIEHQHATG
jgi:hypothetical protein